ncbi:hypothetical protein F4782DRAFT_548782 [Xylaria castorea]|nr:hypothetical protein F4782DRAFT_548782 [Xylaria castorea]
MSDIPSLSQDSRRTVEEFYQRSQFWLQVPRKERHRFWETDNPGQPYLYRASDVIQFTRENCLATTAAHDGELLAEFKRKLDTDWSMNQISPFGGTKVCQLLNEYLVWIDHLFFFRLITHPTRQRPIIKIRFQDRYTNYDGNDHFHGAFSPRDGEVYINSVEPTGEPKAFDKAIVVLLHELVHAYLHLLTRDDSAANYVNEVGGKGHGPQFHRLLEFILSQLSNWVPSIPYLKELSLNANCLLGSAMSIRLVYDDDVARSLIYANSALVE